MMDFKKHLRPHRGIIAVDFLFAFVLVVGLGFILLTLSLTLSVVEITQYITFSSARSYLAAHQTHEAQKTMGKKKYVELVQHPTFAPFYKNGWFDINDSPNIGDHSESAFERTLYENSGDEPKHFFGVSTGFSANVLQFRIPLYGSTTGTDNSKGAFSSAIGSYLGREPSTQDCHEGFNKLRWQAIRQNLGGDVNTYTQEGGYMPIMDNGC